MSENESQKMEKGIFTLFIVWVVSVFDAELFSSQAELLETQRVARERVLQDKDRQIRELLACLNKEADLSAEWFGRYWAARQDLLRAILQVQMLRADNTQLSLENEALEVEIAALQSDAVWMRRLHNEMLGGHKRKRGGRQRKRSSQG